MLSNHWCLELARKQQEQDGEQWNLSSLPTCPCQSLCTCTCIHTWHTNSPPFPTFLCISLPSSFLPCNSPSVPFSPYFLHFVIYHLRLYFSGSLLIFALLFSPFFFLLSVPSSLFLTSTLCQVAHSFTALLLYPQHVCRYILYFYIIFLLYLSYVQIHK